MQGPTHDKEEQMIRWLSGDLDEGERARLEKDPEFDTYRKILQEMDGWSLPWDARASYDALRAKQLERPAKKARTVRMQPFWSWGIAASLLAAVVVYFTIFDSQNTRVTTAAGEQKTIVLPDSSVVRLNGLSEISYNAKAWANTREINLKGNAYFDITPGDLTVRFETGSVSVLGTRFEVAARGEYLSVACYEGKVQVAVHEERAPILLVQDQAVQYTTGRDLERQPGTTSEPAWFGSRSQFTNAPLGQVLKALEAQYGITVNTANIDPDRRYTGEFLHGDLDLALKMICEPLGIGYEKEGKHIILR